MGKPCVAGCSSAGLIVCAGDVLALLQMADTVGIVAKLFLRIDGEVFVCGRARRAVQAQTQTRHSQIWAADQELALAPLDRVAARCTWAPHGADMLVLASGL